MFAIQGHLKAIALVTAFACGLIATPSAVYANTSIKVLVENISAIQHQQQLELSGRLAVGRQVTLVSELRAKVTAIHADKGEWVKQGQLLLSLDQRDWPARVKQAEANLKQRKLEKQSAEKLQASGLANASQLAQVETALANAEAELTSARLQLQATRIRAPFDGIINQRMVEVGDFAKDGTAVLQLVDVSPYKVTARVPENRMADIRSGMSARAKLLDGQTVEGQLSYVAVLADANTRTFDIEVTIANPDNRMIAAGQSAKLQIPLETRPAYKVSPALLILDDDGNLGLKTVDDNNIVRFTPVELEGADQNGVWVFGPASIRLITRGAGFTEVGDQVEVVEHTSDDRQGA